MRNTPTSTNAPHTELMPKFTIRQKENLGPHNKPLT